jgi:hypothetical protein
MRGRNSSYEDQDVEGKAHVRCRKSIFEDVEGQAAVRIRTGRRSTYALK